MNQLGQNGYNQPTALDRLEKMVQELRRWQPKIERALRHAGYTHVFDDIVEMVSAGRLMFFSYDTAFTLMEIVVYPRYRVFHCFLAGGDMEGVLATIPDMKSLGTKLDCRYLTMAGRSGWEKALLRQGWEHVCTTMRIELGAREDNEQGRTADY